MSFFQNPFSQDFRGTLVLGDRAHVPNFVVPRNAGRGDETVIGWNAGPYNLSGNDSDGNPSNVLKVKFSLDAQNFANWSLASFSLTTGAVSTAAVTAAEVVASLNADTNFSPRFTASLDPSGKVIVRQLLPFTRFKFFVLNGNGEEKIRFNSRAGVAELPTYFARHGYDQINTFSDSVALLVPLNTGLNVDSAVISGAVDAKGKTLALNPGTVQADYQLLRGKAGIFSFQKMTVDGSDRITQIIEYPAGALAGDLARKIRYSYSGANTHPSQITEEPYTLTSGDLIVPA